MMKITLLSGISQISKQNLGKSNVKSKDSRRCQTEQITGFLNVFGMQKLDPIHE